jgi:hypothetical protein
MKHICIFILVFALLLCLTGCGLFKGNEMTSDDIPQSTTPSGTNMTELSILPPQYSSDSLQWLDSDDYIDFQGKINNIFIYSGSNEAFQVNNVIHCKEFVDWQKRWSQWTHEDNETIISFDGSTSVTINENQQLKAYVKYGWDMETHEYGLPRVVIPGTESQFVYGYNPKGEDSYTYSYIYKNRNTLNYIHYDLENKTDTGFLLFMCATGTDLATVKSFMASTDGTVWTIVTEDNKLYNVHNDITTNTESAIVTAIDGLYIDGVNGIVATTKHGVYVTIKDDVHSILYYQIESVENRPSKYGNPIKILLPDGHKAQDIKYVDANGNLLLIFDDGICVISPTKSPQVTKLAEINDLVKEGKVLKVAQGQNKILVLMDDGHVYKLTQQ